MNTLNYFIFIDVLLLRKVQKDKIECFGLVVSLNNQELK